MILLMKKRVFVGCLLLSMLVLLIYSGYIFKEGWQSTLSEISNLFDRVVRQDKTHRLKEVDVLSSSGYNFSEKDSTTVLYFNGQVEKIAKKTESDDLITEEKQYRVDQSFLLMENPIDIVALDSLFYLVLQQNNMTNVRAALAYTANNDKTVFSNPDLTFYESSYALPVITTGVKDEIVLQAYVDIPLSYIMCRNKEHFIIVGGLFCLILSILFAAWYNKKSLKPLIEEPRELIKIKKNLLFDKEKGILYFNDDIQVVLENYKLALFNLLLDSPGHFQTSEAIKRFVWKDSVATTDTLNTTIKRLRINLKPISDLNIVFGNSGYRLDIL